MNLADNGRRRTVGTAIGFLAAGAVAGGVLAGTLSAGAASSPSSTAPSSGSPAHPADGDHHGHRGGHLSLSGTVTGVNADTNGTTGRVTIDTSSGTKTYTVDSNSDIDKNGESQLSKLVSGDKVTFALTGTTIDILHAGNEALNQPAGGYGPHDGRHGLDQSGTVTAVNPDSNGTTGTVTIKTPSGTKTYPVDGNSDVDKNGESQLSKLSAGDAVTFSLDGTTVDKLHAGDEAKNAPSSELPAG